MSVDVGIAPSSARRPQPAAARLTPPGSVILFALLFLGLHLPYLPSTLEDLDSINFALGIHQFDVSRHQPHPPGYPVFIALAKTSRTLIGSDAEALSALSVLSASLCVLAIAALFARLQYDGRRPWTLASTALAVTSPLFWFTAVRPLSDAAGLAAAVAVQAAIVGASTRRAVAASAFCAGLATGIRSQVFWLTAPLLVVHGAVAGGRSNASASAEHSIRPDGRARAGGHSPFRDGVSTAAAFTSGVLVWFVPLIFLSGGAAAYWRAISSQGAEDLSGVRMLWTTPTARAFLDSLYYAFIAPWAAWPIAAVVVGFAGVGISRLWWHDRRALLLIGVAFGPYLMFDILFQETFTIRYALPLVLPVAFLAAAGMRALPQTPAAVVVVLVSMFDAHVGGRSIAAYARQPAPAFQLLADMRAAARSLPEEPVLAPDRRESFDLRRPLVWLGAEAPALARQLPAPAQHEWLEAVKYWNGGGRAPVWFVVDPRRAAISLVQHGPPSRYRWSLPYPVLMSGTRPNDADWYRVDRPEWYVGDGWALTPEAAGVSEAGGRGLQVEAIQAWMNRRVFSGGALLIGGRNFDPRASPRITMSVADAQWSRSVQAPPGAFFDVARLPALDGNRPLPEYLQLKVSASPPARVGIEQFDASATRGVLAFGNGWHEPEYDPLSGRRWRWLSGRGDVFYLTPSGEWNLHIEGESPRKYYRRDSRILVREGSRTILEMTAGDDFSLDIPVTRADSAPARLTIETDQTHVPAESRWRRSPDRRQLGVRIFVCELRPR